MDTQFAANLRILSSAFVLFELFDNLRFADNQILHDLTIKFKDFSTFRSGYKRKLGINFCAFFQFKTFYSLANLIQTIFRDIRMIFRFLSGEYDRY